MEVIRQEKYVLECCSEEKDFHVYAKWDGCCDITRYYNGDTYETGDVAGDSDYIHICDLREFIKFLTEIADKAEQIEGFEGYEDEYKTVRIKPLTIEYLRENHCINCPRYYGETHDYNIKGCEMCMENIKSSQKAFQNR